MAYSYDIFLSYRRHPEPLRWIKQHFVPLLVYRVGLELGRDPAIFIDEQIESGTDWPLELANELARSRILVALWTKTYFHSKWCVAELSHMRDRELETKRRTHINRRGLVIPAIIHDCERLGPELTLIQHFEIRDCFNVRMTADSPRAEQLDERLEKEAAAIAKAIRNAPPWKKNWPKKAAKKFFDVYYKGSAEAQTVLPAFASS